MSPANASSHASYHAIGDPLAIIYNEGTWQLNKTSPLYSLEYLPVKLKMYASKVKQAIVKTVQASSVKYAVTFEELFNLKYAEDDSPGIMITVKSTEESKSVTKVCYVAILLSWGLFESLDEAIHLPYLLERGEQKIGTVVKSTLQTLFDCNIRQITFIQHQLLQFAFNFVDMAMCRSKDPFSLIYKIAEEDLNGKHTFTFHFEDVFLLLKCMKETSKSEYVNSAYKILQNQIFNMVSLDVVSFDLWAVNLPNAGVNSNGTVKMKTPEIVNRVFIILNEMTNFYSKYTMEDGSLM